MRARCGLECQGGPSGPLRRRRRRARATCAPPAPIRHFAWPCLSVRWSRPQSASLNFHSPANFSSFLSQDLRIDHHNTHQTTSRPPDEPFTAISTPIGPIVDLPLVSASSSFAQAHSPGLALEPLSGRKCRRFLPVTVNETQPLRRFQRPSRPNNPNPLLFW